MGQKTNEVRKEHEIQTMRQESGKIYREVETKSVEADENGKVRQER